MGWKDLIRPRDISISILFKGTLGYSIVDYKDDPSGRFLMVKCKIQGHNIFLINVYEPNIEKEHESFLKELHDELVSFYDDELYQVVAGGDWNFVEDLDMDKKGGDQKTLGTVRDTIKKNKRKVRPC